MKAVHSLACSAVLLGLLLLSGCAAVDPHNILSRNWRDDNPHFKVDVLGPSGRQNAFDFVWDTIDQRYFDPKFNGIDWKAVGDKYRPRAMATRYDDDFWDLLNRMAGELHDSHTRVETPKEVALRRRQQSASLGIDINRIESRIVVNYVRLTSDAYLAGVRAGMEVTQIDGMPAEARYAQVLDSEREQSTLWAKERHAFRTLLHGEPGTMTTFELTRADGSVMFVPLTRKMVTGGPVARSQRLPSGFGYVRFSSFSMGLRGQVLDAIEAYKPLPGLIIDLRNNGGGAAWLVEDIANQLLREETDAGSMITRTGQPITVFGFPVTKLKRTLSGSPSAYDKPVIILVNAQSASASELLAAGLQDIGRARIVGQRTCGCLLGFLGYATVPGGGELAYSEIGMISPRGRRIEREGVIPDVEVAVTREDLAHGRDRALEEAEELLRKTTALQVTKH